MRGSKKCIILLMTICLSLGVFFQTNASDIIPEEQLMTSSYRKAYVKENEIKIYKFKKENKKLDKALKKLQKTKKVAVTEKGKIGVGSYWKLQRIRSKFLLWQDGIKANSKVLRR